LKGIAGNSECRQSVKHWLEHSTCFYHSCSRITPSGASLATLRATSLHGPQWLGGHVQVTAGDGCSVSTSEPWLSSQIACYSQLHSSQGKGGRNLPVRKQSIVRWRPQSLLPACRNKRTPLPGPETAYPFKSTVHFAFLFAMTAYVKAILPVVTSCCVYRQQAF
jgi:hypothetical protein